MDKPRRVLYDGVDRPCGGLRRLGDGSGRRMDTIARLAVDPAAWAALATLIAMEVVLGVDNLVFIALLSDRVEERRRALARCLGLSIALILRLAMLASAAAIVHLSAPLSP